LHGGVAKAVATLLWGTPTDENDTHRKTGDTEDRKSAAGSASLQSRAEEGEKRPWIVPPPQRWPSPRWRP